MPQPKRIARAQSARQDVQDRYALELDGSAAGWLDSAEGGYATSEVVTEKLGPDYIRRKHLAGVKYEDITIACGVGMSNGFYQWIRDVLDHKYIRKNGALIDADYRYVERSRLNFVNALITEVGFPALDAASKAACRMTVKFAPEYTRMQMVKGGDRKKSIPGLGVQKRWLPTNFRLKIDGLEAACSRASKIEALVIRRPMTEQAVGDLRDYEKEPAAVEIPNLVITVPESHAKSLYDWHEDFVIKGMNGDDKEKNGTLEYLTPNLKEALFTLTFKHLGIFRLAPEKVEPGGENIRRVKAEMYCEEMKFDYKATWA